MWTLEEAQRFCSLLEFFTSPGFGVGLTGSVLISNKSAHDIDIILYPLSSNSPLNDIDVLKEILVKFGMKPLLGREEVTKHWRKKGSLDDKHVEIWNYNGKRVDIFFLK